MALRGTEGVEVIVLVLVLVMVAVVAVVVVVAVVIVVVVVVVLEVAFPSRRNECLFPHTPSAASTSPSPSRPPSLGFSRCRENQGEHASLPFTSKSGEGEDVCEVVVVIVLTWGSCDREAPPLGPAGAGRLLTGGVGLKGTLSGDGAGWWWRAGEMWVPDVGV